MYILTLQPKQYNYIYVNKNRHSPCYYGARLHRKKKARETSDMVGWGG